MDPWRPAAIAVITHAHGDHLRAGSARYLLAREGLEIARRRLPAEARIEALEYGERIRLGDVDVSLYPAGHVRGSAQVRIERAGEAWVVSGDYKRDPDPTCSPFEVVACDVFISEATFALPIYRWSPAAAVAADIVAWWSANRARGMCSVLYVYALGKAQRVLAELAALTDEPVHLHGALEGLTQAYRDAGVRMVPTRPATTERRADFREALVLAPPSAAGTSWMRRFGEHSSGFCSGWMRVRGDRRRRGVDRGFVLSDHADWPSLLRTFGETGAQRILLTHGHTETMTRYLAEQGVDARALATAYGDEDA